MGLIVVRPSQRQHLLLPCAPFSENMVLSCEVWKKTSCWMKHHEKEVCSSRRAAIIRQNSNHICTPCVWNLNHAITNVKANKLFPWICFVWSNELNWNNTKLWTLQQRTCFGLSKVAVLPWCHRWGCSQILPHSCWSWNNLGPQLRGEIEGSHSCELVAKYET